MYNTTLLLYEAGDFSNLFLIGKLFLYTWPSIGVKDLQYISIQQYIDTISMYHDTILYQANINIREACSLNH